VTRHDSRQVTPFGHPGITARLTAPPGLSRPPTSFIGPWYQGIHRPPLPTYPHTTHPTTNHKHQDARVHYANLNPPPTHHHTPPTRAAHSHAWPPRQHPPPPTGRQHGCSLRTPTGCSTRAATGTTGHRSPPPHPHHGQGPATPDGNPACTADETVVLGAGHPAAAHSASVSAHEPPQPDERGPRVPGPGSPPASRSLERR
jgi:hypothetical protein